MTQIQREAETAPGVLSAERVRYVPAPRVEAVASPPAPPPEAKVAPIAAYWAQKEIFGKSANPWMRDQLGNIAVLDSGCDTGHPGFATKRIDADKKSSTDKYGHGTFVCGILTGAATVAPSGSNSTDLVNGMLPQSRVWARNVFNQTAGEFLLDAGNYSKALNLVAKNTKRLQVLNLSLGSPLQSKTESADIAVLVNAGVTVVAASGNAPEGANGAMDPILFPAALPGVLAVGAIAYGSQTLWARTHRKKSAGKGLEICAPGEWILSALPTTANHLGLQFSGWMHGTSMAAPYVSAVAAVLRSQGVLPKDVLLKLTGAAGTTRIDGTVPLRWV
jgi:subtilisin family serine protease